MSKYKWNKKKSSEDEVPPGFSDFTKGYIQDGDLNDAIRHLKMYLEEDGDISPELRRLTESIGNIFNTIS